MTESKPFINDQFFDAELPVKQCIKIALREVTEIADFKAGIAKHFLEMALRQLEREVETEKQH